MDNTNESAPEAQPEHDIAAPAHEGNVEADVEANVEADAQTQSGSKDGDSAADNDQPFRFGRRPNVRAPYPFTERQFARLLILRGRVRSTETFQDPAAA